MIAYFFMWGLFTFYMFIGTLRVNRALQVVFGTSMSAHRILGLKKVPRVWLFAN